MSGPAVYKLKLVLIILSYFGELVFLLKTDFTNNEILESIENKIIPIIGIKIVPISHISLVQTKPFKGIPKIENTIVEINMNSAEVFRDSVAVSSFLIDLYINTMSAIIKRNKAASSQDVNLVANTKLDKISGGIINEPVQKYFLFIKLMMQLP